MYKISLIITVEKNDELLIKNLNSLTKQTIGFENLEIILISDENLNWELLDKFSINYKNIYSYTFRKNKNVNYKNLALNYATAQYIIFLNMHEILFSDSCETLYEIINENKYDIVSGNFIFRKNNKFETNEWENIELKKGYCEIATLSENPNVIEFYPSLGSKIFNREFLIDNNIKFKNESSIEDLIFVTESLQKANGILFLNKSILKCLTEKEHFICPSNNIESLLYFIDDLQNFYVELNEKTKYGKFLLKYVEQIVNPIFLNKFTSKQLLNIFVKINFLVTEYLSNNFKQIKELELLFNLISNKQYDLSIKLIELLNDKIEFDTGKFESRDILLLFYGFEYDIGGLTKAVFNRANLLSNKGLNITLINTDPYTENYIGEKYYNISYIENKFRNLGYINDSVKFINILEYYKEKNKNPLGEKLKAKINLNNKVQIFENYLIHKINDEYNLRIFNYYYLDDFTSEELTIIKNLFKEPMPKNIDSINLDTLFNKNIVKVEYYVDNNLFIESINDDNNQTVVENLYTINGFNYLKIEREDRYKFKYKLYSIESTSEIIFEYYKEFCDYFIKEICLNCNEKPILVNDCSGPIPSFNNIPHEMAYKIANIHSNPYLEPTYCYGSPRREMSALKYVDQLDALVALTETEKNDFIKEFETDNIYSIPNLIDLSEIITLNQEYFEVDTNKISIFARISPEKNIDDLIQAFKLVVDKHPRATLNIYGRAITYGEKLAFDKIQKAIDDLNIKRNIIFWGHVDNAYHEMRTSLATILVSHIEGLPMVIIESMANKTPVISYDINYGPKDTINDGEDGFIVEKYNIEELAEKINYLLDNPDRAIEMGEKAQQNIFDKFNLDEIYKQWLNVFKEAYFTSKYREFYLSYTAKNYIKNTNQINNLLKNNDVNLTIMNEIEKQKAILSNQDEKIKTQNVEIKNKEQTNEKQKAILSNQDEKIKTQNVEIKNKEQTNEKQKNIIKKQEKIIKKQILINETYEQNYNETNNIIRDLKTTNEYEKLKNNPKKRLASILPYLYIIYKHKNIIENIRFCRKITKNEWLDIGYYLNTNTDIKRDKWCKILTPETHYTCHGFDEKRLPHPNYKNNLTKKEIIEKVSDKNV